MSAARTERLLNLLTLLLNARRPVSLRDIRELPEFDAYATADPKSGERAFERDKAALIELGIPLRWVAPEQEEDEESGGGYLVDRERYYLPELLLSPTDVALLSMAGAAAAAIDGFPERGAVVRALAKLGFDVDDTARPVTALAHAPLPPGDPEQLGRHLSTLHDAVARHQAVAMRYKSMGGEMSKRAVDPYGLYYRRGVWYLVAYCHLRKAERTFHLGRIVGADPVGKADAFEVPDSFDLSAHVQRRPWEYGDEPEIAVVIKLAERLVPAISELFGPRAIVSRSAQGTLVRLLVRQRAQLIAAVLPYGAAAEVTAPADLRAELGRIYTALAQRYGATERKKARAR
jgi:predicted DNA-binding transcriptional regulator YafY